MATSKKCLFRVHFQWKSFFRASRLTIEHFCFVLERFLLDVRYDSTQFSCVSSFFTFFYIRLFALNFSLKFHSNKYLMSFARPRFACCQWLHVHVRNCHRKVYCKFKKSIKIISYRWKIPAKYLILVQIPFT